MDSEVVGSAEISALIVHSCSHAVAAWPRWAVRGRPGAGWSGRVGGPGPGPAPGADPGRGSVCAARGRPGAGSSGRVGGPGPGPAPGVAPGQVLDRAGGGRL